MIKANNIYRYAECLVEKTERCTTHLKFCSKLAGAPIKLKPWYRRAVTSCGLPFHFSIT